MSTLQVHITAGPQAGARFQLNTSPVSFGRSPENTLALDVSVVSRQHGELVREEDGTWVLINHSANGTRVGRKKVTKKPLPLTNGASIIIGDTEVFRVYLTGADAQAQTDDNFDEDEPAQPAGRAPGAGLKGRSKLWIGLGVWFALCIGVMIFLATLKNDTNDNTGNNAGIWNPGQSLPVSERGPDADTDEVRDLLLKKPRPQDPNQSLYDKHLADARAAADRGNRGLYEAYQHYQQAIAYSSNRSDPLASLDQIKFDNTINQLAGIIAVEYRRALRLYDKGDYEQAAEILFSLKSVYYSSADPEDELANHINRLRNAAQRRVK